MAKAVGPLYEYLAEHYRAKFREALGTPRPSDGKVTAKVDMARGVIHVTVAPCPASKAGLCTCVDRCELSSGGP
jgi:hypothetical protein